MELVLRTAYGEAELVIRATWTDLTLLELVERVSGQPCPPVVTVDGRSLAADTPLSAAGLLTGSVLSTLEAPATVGDPVAALVPIAGPGVGVRIPLEVGEYRIGPGRRVSAPEFDFAPVDESAIQLHVLGDGTAVVSDLGQPAWVNGRPAERGTPWPDGLLETADRVLRLEAGVGEERPESNLRTIGADGRVSFNRPPLRRGAADALRGLADSLSTVFGDHRCLWHRRSSDEDAFRLAIGLAPADRADEGIPRPLRPVDADLDTSPGLGIVGGSDFTTAAARGLLLQAATALGPADLDVAVVTTRGRIHMWEWVKWLPHAQPTGEPQLFVRHDEIRAWIAGRTGARGTAAENADSPPAHLTLVVVDDLTAINERSAPLRALLGDKRPPTRFVALAGSAEEVPAICTTTIEEGRGHGAVVEYFDDGRRLDPVHPFVPEQRVALDAARRLAGFSDPELIVDTPLLPRGLSLERLLGMSEADTGAIAARWFAARRSTGLTAPVGVAADGTVEVTFERGALELLVIGSPGAGSGGLVENLLVALAVDHAPGDVNLMLIALSDRPVLRGCARLPHAVEMISDPTAETMQRALRCLRAEVARRQRTIQHAGARSYDEHRAAGAEPRLPRLLLVLDEAAPSDAGHAEFVASLLEIATDGQRYGVHLIAASERHRHLDRSIARAAHRTIVLRLDDPLDDDSTRLSQIVLPRFIPRRAVLLDSAATTFQAVTSVRSALPSNSPLAVEPYVIGREPTSIERRLSRLNRLARDTSADTELTRLIDTIHDAAVELDQHEQPSPCPAPLPVVLPLRELLDRYSGDGVPFALEDLPDEQRQSPRWWEPGPTGGLALYASDPDERTDLVIALALGVAERASPDDVHLYVVGDGRKVLDPRSLGALSELPHTGAVIGLDEGQRLEALVHHLDEEITRRADLAERFGSVERVTAAEPAIAVLVDGLGELRQRLRRQSDGDGILLDFERAIREGTAFGICAVLTASAPRYVPRALLGDLDQIVLRLDDAHELGVFGIRRSDFPVDARGRGLRPAGPSEVQLVRPPEDVPGAIGDLRLEPAQDRPPPPIDTLGPRGRT